ncbi:Nicotinamide nucleotide repair protein [Jannaschia seosinensis]|uniref:Bifunctional NAD(P)H-hydrate repair enzyme n=1 Tax=Jannaschia seosinensis TaxID=313367 RepID=A0A0M7B696_9RHOB|nr:NAD(P)H-hydrate dehydratase [Jannaschia seosinensis]CUH31649.1 Nicotinamide nucleotide repair protein [Jannaschia seosinensis]
MAEILLNAARMRALEQAVMVSGLVSGRELMERAGRGAVAAIETEWPGPGTMPRRAGVLCGPGNNGGDGFVVARLLREKGWEVEVFLYGDPEKLPPDARTNYELWSKIGEVHNLPEEHTEDPLLYVGRPDLWIDAVFGIGQTRALPDAVVDVLHRIGGGSSDRAAPVVAIDLPSGLSSDSGKPLQAFRPAADLTVTFHGRKPGHLLADGPACCGNVRVVDIGLGSGGNLPSGWKSGQAAASGETTRAEGRMPLVRLISAEDVRALSSKELGHKYDHGHALVLAGPMGRTGAARLSARAALRIGAGLVTVAAPGSAMMECAAQLTAIMLRRCDDGAALRDLLDDSRLNVVCLGPGLGTDKRAAGLVEAALASGRTCVLDADALTVIAGHESLFAALHGSCVLTPHAGEFARLFPDIAERLNAPEEATYSKVEAAGDAASRAGCTVLFKGPDTVVADASGCVALNAAVRERAAPWLATAGTGDVLTGLVGGLLARGLSPFDAACSATWLHVEAARAFGPGLVSEDLPEMLPHIFASLNTSGC